jgi:hypothetical protein
MAFEHKENSGSLFTNSKKNKDTQPDYTGTINIDGTLYQISAWKNEAKSGKKYFGLKVQLPLVRTQEEQPTEFKEKDLPF